MVERRVERKIQEAEISQGTLFTVREFGKETERVDVIIDIGEDDWFESARIRFTEDRRMMIGIGGTGGPDNFGKVVGQLTAEQILEAARLGTKVLYGYELSDNQVNLYKEAALRGSRKLVLRNNRLSSLNS